MSPLSTFTEDYLDYSLGAFRRSILCRGHGNYTKSYESFKRIDSTERFFLQAIRGRHNVTVLDVGCGDGYHLFVFNTDEGVRKTVSFRGVDISGLHIEVARRVARTLGFENMQFEERPAEDLGYPNESFDVVLCSDVVEHLENPGKCLAEIFRVLMPGGTAIITTPNPSSIVVRMADWMRQIGFRPRAQGPEDDPRHGGHISLLGLKEWTRMAEETGFEVSAVRRGALLFGGYAYNRRPALFALLLLADRLLDALPVFRNWGEAFTMKIVKS